jgi:hypothetical protein
MSTVAFVKAGNSVKVTIDSVDRYVPVNMVPEIDSPKIYFRGVSTAAYDFSIEATDTITAEGNSVTGTAEQIADELAEVIFVTVSGGAGVSLSDANIWTANQSIALDQNGVTKLAVSNFQGEAASEASIELIANRELYIRAGDAYTEIQTVGGPLRITTGSTVQVYVGSTKVFAIPGAINDRADNAAAIAAGLTAGDVYRTGDVLKIVHD